ncbi:hypothetical protein STEG23_007075 [Scotinomys teguina]
MGKVRFSCGLYCDFSNKPYTRKREITNSKVNNTAILKTGDSKTKTREYADLRSLEPETQQHGQVNAPNNTDKSTHPTTRTSQRTQQHGQVNAPNNMDKSTHPTTRTSQRTQQHGQVNAPNNTDKSTHPTTWTSQRTQQHGQVNAPNNMDKSMQGNKQKKRSLASSSEKPRMYPGKIRNYENPVNSHRRYMGGCHTKLPQSNIG